MPGAALKRHQTSKALSSTGSLSPQKPTPFRKDSIVDIDSAIDELTESDELSVSDEGQK